MIEGREKRMNEGNQWSGIMCDCWRVSNRGNKETYK